MDANEVERIRLRCVCGDDGCWLWAGSTNGSNLPTMCRIVDGKRINISGRKWMYLVSGGALGRGEVVSTSCGVRTCLNPEHLKKSSLSRVQKRRNAADPGLSLRRSAAIRASYVRNGMGRKLSPDQAEWARTCGEPAKDVALALGVSASTVRYIRAGKLWKSSRNPFAGLGA